MNLFEQHAASAKGSAAAAYESTRPVLQTANTAFGGHISKGLLGRARSAADKLNTTSAKSTRADTFLKLSAFPDLRGYRMTAKHWEDLSELIYKMTIWADLGDRYDFRNASTGISCWDKIQAVSHFVNRYAPSRIRRKLFEQLNLITP